MGYRDPSRHPYVGLIKGQLHNWPAGDRRSDGNNRGAIRGVTGGATGVMPDGRSASGEGLVRHAAKAIRVAFASTFKCKSVNTASRAPPRGSADSRADFAPLSCGESENFFAFPNFVNIVQRGEPCFVQCCRRPVRLHHNGPA